MVEALLPSGGGRTGNASAVGGKPLSKDTKGKWIRNKLKALARLLGRSEAKVAEVLPGIIGVILSWILNRAANLVGWVSQNILALVIGIGGLLYMYMVTKM